MTKSPLILRVTLAAAFAASPLFADAKAQTVETQLPAAWRTASHDPAKTKPTESLGADPDGTWTANSNGVKNWGDSANWSGGTIADGGGTADFSTLNIGNARNPNLETSHTVGMIKIGDTNNSDAYTLSATVGATLIFDNVSLSGANTKILETTGSKGDTISAPIVLNSALDISNVSSTGGVLTLSGGITAGTAGTKIITSSTGAVAISAIGTGSGVIAIVQNGPGSLSISGADSYTGGVTLNAGTLNINSKTALGATTSTLTINGGIVDTTNASLALSQNNQQVWNADFTFLGTGSLDMGTGVVSLGTAAGTTRAIAVAANTLTEGGVISNGTTANGLIKNGAGILVLNAANLFTGGVTINAGIVSAGSATALGPSANATLTFGAGSTGKFQLNGNNTTVIDLNTNVSVGTPVIENGSGNKTLTVNTVNADIFAGVLQDGASGTLSLTKIGAGSLTLSGINTYTGATTLSAGILNINSTSAIGTSILTVNGATIGNTSGNAITLSNGNNITLTGTMTFAGPNDLSFGNDTVTMNGGNRTIAVNGGDALTIGGISEDVPPRNFTKNGNGTLILIGSSSYTGTTTVSNGTLQIGNGGTAGSLSTSSAITDNGTLVFNRSTAIVQGTDFTGTAIGGTGSITQIGTGSLTLNAANTYLGGTTVSNGTLAIGNDNALGTGTFAISGGTVTAVSGPHSVANATTLGAGNGTIAGANDLTFTGSFTETAGDRTLTVSNTGTTTFSAVNLSGNNTGHIMTVTGAGNVVLNGVVADGGTGAGSLIFDAGYAGTATINGGNTFSGGTTLSAGTFVLGNKSAFGTGAVSWGGITASANTDLSGASAIANAGTLKNINTFTGSNNIELSGTLTNSDNAGGIRNTMSGATLTLSGTLNLSNNASPRTFTFNGSGNTLVSGMIQDGGATAENLVKSQGGTLQVTNVATYTGSTTISGGVLDINSNATTTGRLAGTSNVAVNGSGTLMLSNTGATSSIDRINDAAILTMNGGTFKTGGLSEHGATNNTAGIGAMTLQSSSVLNLGNGSSVIAFANSSAQIWSGTLSIYNWTGSPSGGGTDQVYFGSDNTGLTATQIAEITFYSDTGVTALGIAQMLADGEIVPVAVPEPATWASALFITAGVTVQFLRKRRFRQTS